MFTKKIFTPEIIEFIKNNAACISSKDLAILVNKKFNTDFTELQIKSCKSNHKIKSGYKPTLKSNIPAPTGTEYINDGYIKVKIAEPGKWINKGVLVWEKEYGKIPKGHYIIYLDNNGLNTDIKNLACISNADLCRLAKYGKNNGNAQLRQTKINLLKLKAAIQEKKQKGTKK